MKNVFKRLASMLLALVLVVGLIPFTANAWSFNAGATVHFQTGWTNPCVQLMIGHNTWSQGYQMTADSEAIASDGQKVYTIKTIQWDNATQCAVFGTDSVWAGENNNIAHRKNYAPASTNVISLSGNLDGSKEYVITGSAIKEVLTLFSFDANGGTGTMASIGHRALKYTLPECTFTAPEGKVFAGWSTSADGAVITTGYIKTLEDTTLYAQWEDVPSYTVTVEENITGGSVSADKSTATAGQTVTVTATADSGYVLDKITYTPSGGSTVELSGTTTFPMPAADVTVSATFKAHQHNWSYTGSGTATLTGTCSGCDETETYTITAPKMKVYGDGNSPEATLSFAPSNSVKYFGIDGTNYEKSNTPPTAAGSYSAGTQVFADGKYVRIDYTIAKATPTITTVPTASAITFGDALMYSQLTGGEASVPGTFRWDISVLTPGVADSQTTEYTVVFTPTDTANYNSTTCKVKLTVKPRPTTVLYAPTASTISFGQTLANSTLTGGILQYTTIEGRPGTLSGTATWKDSTIAPSVADSETTEYTVIFTPNDINFAPAECQVTLRVTPMESIIFDAPTPSVITEGQTLADSSLSGGAAYPGGGAFQQIPGTFSWKDGTIKPTAADSDTTLYTVVFTPSDSNYAPTTISITLTVKPMHTVTLDPNYGSEAPRTEDVEDGSGLAYTAQSYAPSARDGYRFEGWFASDDNGATLTGEAVDLDELTVTEDITLYAKWLRCYDLYIAGEQVTELNCADVLDDGTVRYDPATNTLTLTNADITGNDTSLWVNHSGVGICYIEDAPLTLKLVGSSTVTGHNSTSISPAAIEIHDTDLIITGSGDLTASARALSGTTQEGCYGILVTNGSFTMNGTGDLNISADSQEDIAYCYAISVTNNVTVNSGKVVVSGNADGTGSPDVCHGICADKITVDADTATLESYGTGSALDASTITLKGSNYLVTAKDEEDSEELQLKTVAADQWETYDYVRIDPNVFTVTYVADGETVDTQYVKKGEDASAPTVPAKDGYTGAWDSDGKNITENTTITAVYTQIPTVTVSFDGKVSLTGRTLKAQEFFFALTEADADFNRVAPQSMDLEVNAADGTFTLEPHLPYDEAGTYYYRIEQVTNGPGEATITYDDTVYQVTVVVTETEGSLRAQAHIAVEGEPYTKQLLEFANVYTAPQSGSDKNEVPDTGDDSNILLWVIVLSVSALAVIVLIVGRKKFTYVAKHVKK